MNSFIELCVNYLGTVSFIGNIDLRKVENIYVFFPVDALGLCLIFRSFEVIFILTIDRDVGLLCNYGGLLN